MPTLAQAAQRRIARGGLSLMGKASYTSPGRCCASSGFLMIRIAQAGQRRIARGGLSLMGKASSTSPGRCCALSGFFMPTLAQAVLGSVGHEKAPVTSSPGLGLVGVRGFEPPTSSSRTTRANRAALHPERCTQQLGNALQGAANINVFRMPRRRTCSRCL